MGAIAPWRWHWTQDRCRIGATSFVNVTAASRLCAAAVAGVAASPMRAAKLSTHPFDMKRSPIANIRDPSTFPFRTRQFERTTTRATVWPPGLRATYDSLCDWFPLAQPYFVAEPFVTGCNGLIHL